MCRNEPARWGATLVALVALGCGNRDPASFADSPARGDTPDGGPVAEKDAGGAPLTGAGGASPGSCLPPLARCDASGACCAGSVCTAQGSVSRCVQRCDTRFDCGSLCCLPDAKTGVKLCAEESACPPLECSGVGGPCTQPGPSCCTGLACVSSPSKDFGGCRQPCQASAECDTGCCVPYANGELGFCAAASACACAPLESECGGTRHCCSGSACTTFDDTGAFACKPTCRANADCATGCCRPIDGTAESACLPKTWCQ